MTGCAASFKFIDDMDGVRCPVSSHIRRANTRDMLDPNPRKHGATSVATSVLNNRRRILRRGLPYGVSNDPAARADNGEHGIIFMARCASLFRQFKFVQQQWINYGLDFTAPTTPARSSATTSKTTKATSTPSS
jgi:deferrochelatase/peroxidase EfeB